jgi:hypothetical protein
MRRTKLTPLGLRRLLKDLRGVRDAGQRGRKTKSPATTLRRRDEQWLKKMRPGDIFVLPEAETSTPSGESEYFAVLACPVCGTPGLITAPQYFGTVPVTCASNRCSCRFQIDEQSRLVYLPMN